MTKTKTCQNCKNKFIIEPADFEFYKKIEVPEPTFCPECRMIRRMAFRKEAPLFYRRKCEGTSKDLISIYNPNSPIKVYEQKYWFSDMWDPMDYGMDYDFNEPFFEQFKKLLNSVPEPATINDDAVDSNYCDGSNYIKDCYLTTNSGYGENLAYANRTVKCKDSLDIYITDKSELCYQDLYCSNSYKLFFSDHCDSCIESYFLYDCRNCKNCIGCANLRHKQYYIFNKPYSKKEYNQKVKELNLRSYSGLLRLQKKFGEFRKKSLHKFGNITKSVNVSGNEIANSKNCHYVFDIKDCENLKYVNWAGFGYPLKDSYDSGPGVAIAELLYECVNTGLGGDKNLFGNISWSNYNIEYIYHCRNSRDLFGCVGLRHKKYCILNKQYTKDDYKKLVAKIKKHMNDMPYIDKKGRVYKYGEFFPIELSPFSYDETVAQDISPLNKKKALKKGYSWLDKPKSEYQLTITAKDLPDDIRNINDNILQEVIGCANAPSKCVGSGVFKLTPKELKFYKKQNLPLPRLCPLCRHRERIKQRNPMKLHHRQCQCTGKESSNKLYQNTISHPHHKNKPCPNTFQTTYAPDRKEIVYCEECYLKEIG